MKTKYMIIIVCMIYATFGFAQNKMFDKYAEMDDVTYVYISKAMFKMMPVKETAGLNLMNMLGKMESLQLVTTEKKEIGEQMRKGFPKLIGAQHEELMRIRDGKTKVTFYADMKGDYVEELIMLADTEGQFTALLLVGKFTLQDIQDITKNMNK